jgi:hypothetical protein
MMLFREARTDDIDALAPHMRAIDALECKLVGGHEPREALENALDVSSRAKAWEVGGVVQCLYGCAPVSFLSDEASIWLLGRDSIKEHARAFLKVSKGEVEDVSLGFERLFNVVHAHNRLSIRWLKWLGFAFGEGIEVQGHPFLPFELARGNA